MPQLTLSPDAQRFQDETCSRPVRNQSSTLIGVTWAFFAVVVVSVTLRLLSRWSGLNGTGYSWDDWVVAFCFVLAIPLDVGLDQGARLGLAQDMWRVTVNNIEYVLKWFYITEILYITIVMAAKIAIVLLYLRIWTAESLTKAFRVACWAMIAVLIATAIAFDLAVIFQCSPISYAWTHVTRGTGSCIAVEPLMLAFGALNVIYSVVVFLLPVYSILRLSISVHKKIGVSSIFAIGLVVTIATIVRLQYWVRTDSRRNVTWEYQYVGLWSVIEANLIIICACVPAIIGLIQRWCRGDLSAEVGGFANGSMVTQKVLGRRRGHGDDSDADTPGIIATEMTQHNELSDLESALTKDQFDGQSGTSKIGEMDMKSIGSNSTSNIMERVRPSGNKKMASLFPDSNNPEATALVYRPQPGKNNKVEISHDPPTQPAEARLAYRDENDIYHEVTITDIPHGRFPLHSKGKARPSGLGALAEAENSDELRTSAQVQSGPPSEDASKSDSVRSSDPRGHGVVLPKTGSLSESPAPNVRFPPVSQLGYQSLNGSFDGTSGRNSHRNSQMLPGRPVSQVARSISLASGTMEAVQIAQNAPSPPSSYSNYSRSDHTRATQTDATSVDDSPQRGSIREQEVVYTPRSVSMLKSPSKSVQANEASLSPPPRRSVDNGIQVSPDASQSPQRRWEWPSDNNDSPRMQSPAPPPELDESNQPFMRAPSPAIPPSPPLLPSNIPQIAAINREYSPSRSRVREAMFASHSRSVSRQEGPMDQFANEPIDTRMLSRSVSPPLPATSQPNTSELPSHEVTFIPRGRSPPRPQSVGMRGPRSASSEALHAPPLPTRDMGTEIDADETDNPRTPSVPRTPERWPSLVRTASQLDMQAQMDNQEVFAMPGSPLPAYPDYNEDGNRPMSGEFLPPSTYQDMDMGRSPYRSPSPGMSNINIEAANEYDMPPQPSADAGVQTGMPNGRGRSPPVMNMPLPAMDIEDDRSPRTASSQAVPMMVDFDENFDRPPREPSPTAMMAGIAPSQSPPRFNEDMRPPLSQAGSDQWIPRAPSPTTMMSGVVPDDYYEERRPSLAQMQSPSPMRSPSPIHSPQLNNFIQSPRGVTSPRYESADAGTSPMSNGDDDEVLGVGIGSPPRQYNRGSLSADVGTSPMSNYNSDDDESPGMFSPGRALPSRDIEQQRSASADRGTSPMSGYNSDEESPLRGPSRGPSPDIIIPNPNAALPTRDINDARSASADRGTSPMSDWNDDDSPHESPGPHSADVVVRSMSADRGTSPMHTDSPHSPLPGLASRSHSHSATDHKDGEDVDMATSPMSTGGLPSPHYDADGKRDSGDIAVRPLISPLQPMKRISNPSSEEQTPAHTQLPFAGKAGREEIPQPPARRPSQLALPKGASGIEDTFTESSPANRAQDLTSVHEDDETRPQSPDDRGRGLPPPPMTYGGVFSPNFSASRRPSAHPDQSSYDNREQSGERFGGGWDSRDQSGDRFYQDNDYRYDQGPNELDNFMPYMPQEFDNYGNFDNQAHSPVRGIDDDDIDWAPRQVDYHVPHIPSPLLAQLAGASPGVFDSEPGSRSRSGSRSPESDGGRRNSRSISPTQRELTRMGEAAAADVFESNRTPFLPVPSAVARQADRTARESFQDSRSPSPAVRPSMSQVSLPIDDSRAMSPAGNAYGVRSPDVQEPPPPAPEDVREQLAMIQAGTDAVSTDTPDPYPAQLAALNPRSPSAPSTARLREALETASPDILARDLPNGVEIPEMYQARLAAMDPQTRSVSVSRPTSAWPAGSPVNDNETLPNWGATKWDEVQSPALRVVSPGIDDHNDTQPTTPGDESPPHMSPERSPEGSPLASPGQGVRLSSAEVQNEFSMASPEMASPGSEFLPTRPVSQLNVPTLSDMDTERESPNVPTSAEISDPSPAVDVKRKSDPPGRRFDGTFSSGDSMALSPPRERSVPRELEAGANMEALRTLWQKAESAKASVTHSATNTPYYGTDNEALSPSEQPDVSSSTEAGTESWYNPTVLPRLQSPSPDTDKADASAQTTGEHEESADPYLSSMDQTLSEPDTETAEPTAESVQKQLPVEADDEIFGAPSSPQADVQKNEDEQESSPDLPEAPTDPVAEALLSEVPADKEHTFRSVAGSGETAGFVAASGEAPSPDAMPSPGLKGYIKAVVNDQEEREQGNESKTEQETAYPRSPSPAANWLGTLGQPPKTPALLSPGSEGLSTRPASSYYSAIASPTGLGFNSSRPSSGEHSSFVTPMAEKSEPFRPVSQLNLPTIGSVTESDGKAEAATDDEPSSSESLPKVLLGRSSSHESRSGSVTSGSSGPSWGSLEVDSPTRAESVDTEDTGPSTPPDEVAKNNLLSKSEMTSPRIALANEARANEEGEKLRRPTLPMRTVSQLGFDDDES